MSTSNACRVCPGRLRNNIRIAALPCLRKILCGCSASPVRTAEYGVDEPDTF
eukprot:COSAG04_NODE_22740_length_350_cov_0.422311_2_plen_51_part_01